MKNKAVKNVLTAVVAVAIMGVFFYQVVYLQIINKSANPNSEMGKLLMMDVEAEYPEAARDVVKLYNRMIKALHDNKWKDKDLNELTIKMKSLFDNELAANNPDAQFFKTTKADMDAWRKAKKVIVGGVVEREKDVEYSELNGAESATLNASYTIREKKSHSKTYNQFILRKDSDGRWKILGMKAIEEVSINGD